MRKNKKIKTTIIEKFNYNDTGISIDPTLLLKLLEFAHTEAKTDEQLHSIVGRAHVLSHAEECLGMDHYYTLVSEPVTPVETPVEVPAENPMEVV
jgi:hypothetical protein